MRKGWGKIPTKRKKKTIDASQPDNKKPKLAPKPEVKAVPSS